MGLFFFTFHSNGSILCAATYLLYMLKLLTLNFTHLSNSHQHPPGHDMYVASVSAVLRVADSNQVGTRKQAFAHPALTEVIAHVSHDAVPSGENLGATQKKTAIKAISVWRQQNTTIKSQLQLTNQARRFAIGPVIYLAIPIQFSPSKEKVRCAKTQNHKNIVGQTRLLLHDNQKTCST